MSSSRDHRAALQERLQRLRAITNSSAVNKASIIVDASKYIEELKQKVATLNQEIGTSRLSIDENRLPAVTVETLQKGFLINVFSEKNCPGLLVSILEAFENLGLDVLDARVSCTDNFQLEAIGGESDDNIDAQVVKQAVLEAIKNWSEQD
ncbi:Myc-type basic helix-loop-helix domain containing protein [Parasponia andersonii]|uniref:Myc-type basic helix-loop-helix domain containing protein n=1 Tax=Parasponia andersonii TaxID=3476 RepID=A0A2P5BXN6_PARAD|nr:Myc-type basic helix-loop-helix domain containing protein [Parasponia andersonii]